MLKNLVKFPMKYLSGEEINARTKTSLFDRITSMFSATKARDETKMRDNSYILSSICVYLAFLLSFSLRMLLNTDLKPHEQQLKTLKRAEERFQEKSLFEQFPIKSDAFTSVI